MAEVTDKDSKKRCEFSARVATDYVDLSLSLSLSLSVCVRDVYLC